MPCHSFKDSSLSDIIAATEHACSQLKDNSQAESLGGEVVKILSKGKPPRSNIYHVLAEGWLLCHLTSRPKSHWSWTRTKLIPYWREPAPMRNWLLKLIQISRNWGREGRISDSLYNHLYPTAETTPKFYGLPRIHGTEAPLWPLISSLFGSMMYNTTKFLSKILRSLVVFNGHHIIVKSSSTTSQTLKNPWERNLCQTMFLCCLQASRCIFQVPELKQGAVMGFPISTTIANLYMEQFESGALDSTPTPSAMWCQYVDGTITRTHDYQ